MQRKFLLPVLLLLLMPSLLALPAYAARPLAGYGMLSNTGFEEGFYNIGGTWNGLPLQVGNAWTLFNLRASANWMDTRVYAQGGWVEKVEGSTSQFVFGTQNYRGGIYQHANVTPGHTYSFGAALLPMWDRWNEAAHKGQKVAFAIYTGIDPNGGSDPNSPNIVWSPPNNVDFTWNGKTSMVAARAAGNTITCFIKIDNPDTTGVYWETVIDGAYLNEAPSASASVTQHIIKTSSTTVTWSGTTTSDSAAGTASVSSWDVQYRDGPNGAWTDWLVDLPSYQTSATFSGALNHTYYFRTRMLERYPPGMLSLGAFAGGDGDTWVIFDQQGPAASFAPPLPDWINTTAVQLGWNAVDLPAPGSGISNYQVQVSDNSGNWQTLSNGMALSTTYNGQNTHSYRFRVQATDGIGNTGAWTESNPVSIDTIPPSSATISSTTSTPAKSYFVVYWSGQDAGSGVATYDIEVNDGSGYSPWLTHTSLQQGLFTGNAGVSYSFRLRAIDRAGNRMADFSPNILTVTAGNDSSGLGLSYLPVTISGYTAGW